MTELTNTHSEVDTSFKVAFEDANENRDYKVYVDLMDAALEAKKRSIFPHFGNLREGAIIVDAGSGTGAMAEATAEEFRGTRVYALDVSHELMERASEGQTVTHLVYGDAAEQNFPDNSVDVKFYSTSGHEIESFGGSGRMVKSVRSTFAELKPEGRIIIRDFAKPTRTAPVYMQILSEVGTDDVEKATIGGVINYNLLSTRALFEIFHQEFAGGNAFGYEMVTIDGKEYIKLPPEWAHEFYLRKDYTGNWRQEIREKYTYWTPEEAKRILLDAGFNDVEVIPDPNEYILENRLNGKITLFERDEAGNLIAIPFPPTHMVVVGTKPGKRKDGDQIIEDGVDYRKLKDTIEHNEEARTVRIEGKEFEVLEGAVQGSKKMVFHLEGEPPRVLKVVRKDGLNDHTMFKAMYQSIVREHLLVSNRVPHARILEIDPEGPPYRYFVQEAIPQGSICAAELIKDGSLTEEDVKQMATYINSFELGRKWQIDTNPFNWYRVTKEDGTTEMVYIDGKVYRYDEDWEFRKIGLLQWTNPEYVDGMSVHTAIVPKRTKYEELRKGWADDDNNSEEIMWWKKYLSPVLQPSSE